MLKLIASPGARAALLELAPQFEKATGYKVAMDFAVIAVLKRRIAAGEAFDVVIPGPPESLKRALLAAKALGAAARALQPFLTSPAVIPVFKAKGLERD